MRYESEREREQEQKQEAEAEAENKDKDKGDRDRDPGLLAPGADSGLGAHSARRTAHGGAGGVVPGVWECTGLVVAVRGEQREGELGT